MTQQITTPSCFGADVDIDVGEVGIHHGEIIYILRLSWAAMDRLGAPEEIVRVFTAVMQDPPDFSDALAVMYACSEHDISHIVGAYSPAGYEPGMASQNNVIQLTRCLLKHGLVGSQEHIMDTTSHAMHRGSEPKYTSKFEVTSLVASAKEKLGVTQAEALHMTTTSFLNALRVKHLEGNGASLRGQ